MIDRRWWDLSIDPQIMSSGFSDCLYWWPRALLALLSVRVHVSRQLSWRLVAQKVFLYQLTTRAHGVTACVNVVDANMWVCVCVCVWCYRDQRTLFIHPCCCLPSGGIITHTQQASEHTHTHASTLVFAAASSCQIANQSGGEGRSERAEQK